MKSVIFILMLLMCASELNAQSKKEKYALELFNNFEYKAAADVYFDLAKQAIKGSDFKNVNILGAAKSSYYSRGYSRALDMFKKYAGDLNEKETMMYYDVIVRTDSYKEGFSTRELEIFKSKLNFWTNDIAKKIDELKIKNKTVLNKSNFNSNYGDYGASVINDTIYFASNRSDENKYPWDNLSYSNVFSAHNGVIKSVKNLNTKYHDGPVAIDQDGKYYVTRTTVNKGSKILEVFVHNSLNGDGVPFFLNNPSYSVGHISFSSDFKKMYFTSDMPGGIGGTDIYYCVKDQHNKWSTPVNYKEVNTVFDEMFPTENLFGKFYFSSNGYLGLGGFDNYFIDFDGKIHNMGAPLNSPDDDFSLHFTNEKIGFISSDRTDRIDRIYNFELLLNNGLLQISALHARSLKAIEGVRIVCVDREKNDSLVFETNENGIVNIPIISDADYVILGTVKDFELVEPLYLNTSSLGNNETINKNLKFNQVHYDLIVKTIDKATGEVVADVVGDFIDPVTGVKIPYHTDQNGIALINIENYKEYDVTAKKKGFLDAATRITSSSEMLIEVDLDLVAIKKNTTFKIENIYYDLDKSNLRDSSKAELDKLFDFLKENDNIVVELSSHTDSRGSDAYNLKLSHQRALACVNYLVAKGINSANIIARGYGETKLVNHCKNGVTCDETLHEKNRRTEIRILEIK